MIRDETGKRRRSIRLSGYDYSQPGAYFVTICTRDRECLFGEIINSEMQLNIWGTIVQEELVRTPTVRLTIEIDAFVVMPNHIHVIVAIDSTNGVGAHSCAPLPQESRTRLYRQKRSLGSFVDGFTSTVAKRINRSGNSPGIPIWQRNYYERIIRNENELNDIRQYIRNNSLQWELDENNPRYF